MNVIQRGWRGRRPFVMSMLGLLLVCGLTAASVNAARERQGNRAASPAELYQQATHQEDAVGNLEAAIDLYRRALAAKPDRATAAKAQLRIGVCLEKLGKPEAAAAFEVVARDYADQTSVVAEARRRLAATQGGQNAGMTSRKVWDGPGADRYGSVSADGRYVSYTDPETRDLGVHDLMTGAERRLTTHPVDSAELAEYSVFSPDGGRLAYGWRNTDAHYELRTIRREGGEAKLLYSNGAWLMPYGWSPDGRDVLAVIVRGDRTRQLVFVSASDGSVRALRTLDWNMGVPSRAEYSPDGRFVAYDRRSDAGGPSDVFLIAVDGTREVPVALGPSDDLLLGWFPDGGSVLVSSDRTGGTGAWAVSVRDGQPQSDPRLVRPNIGQFKSNGFTRAGDFFYFLSVGVPDVLTASMDPASGQVTEAPTPLPHLPSTGRAAPAWSPDGQRIAYRIQGTLHVGIRDLKSGSVQTTPMKLSYAETPNWTPDGRALLAVGTDLDARGGVFRIDPTTGAAESLGVTAGGLVGRVALTPDGERLFYRRFDERSQGSGRPGTVVVVRHLKTGQERELYRQREREIADFDLSPDGQWLTFRVTNTDDTRSLEVMPAAGGSPRTILRDKMSELAWGGFAWSADGRYVLLVRGGALWRVPVNSDAPEKLDLAVKGMNGIRVHPDGRRLAIVALDIKGEIWAMGNLASTARAVR